MHEKFTLSDKSFYAEVLVQVAYINPYDFFDLLCKQ